MSTLHEQRASAYQANLFADEEGAVLVTPTGFTTLRLGTKPEERTIDLGPVAVRQGGSLVFWRSGKLRQIPLSGGDERDLAPLPRAPLYLLASESQVAWIQTDGGPRSSLQTLSERGVHEVHALEGRVHAAVMRKSVVYCVLQQRDGSWTIGALDLDGQHRAATRAHRGRAPAMLAPGRDGVYFYDGPERGVRKLSFDLQREDAVLTNVICSPLVVSSRVVCAHVGGLFEIAPSDNAPHFLASESAGPITATAATDERAFWVAENGDGQLVVRTVPLSRL